MSAAKTGDEVIIDYIVRTGDGRVVGGTERDGSHKLTLGGKEIFAEVEEALAGMSAGDEKAVTIPSEKAFGPRQEEMVVDIPRDQLPPDPAPQPGMQLSANGPDGEAIVLTIVEIGPDKVVADGNHPLAGEDLHFALTLVEISKSS